MVVVNLLICYIVVVVVLGFECRYLEFWLVDYCCGFGSVVRFVYAGGQLV